VHPSRTRPLAAAFIGAALVLGLLPGAAGADPSYSVTLTASATTLALGAEVTLTATANQVIESPYGIVIVDGTGATIVSCFGSVSECVSFPMGWNDPRTITYTARVVDTANTDVLATSDPVTVRWGAGSTTGDVICIAGANRYATAAALATERFSTGVAAAFVVVGTNFPDALAAAPAAARLGGPVLLTQRTSLPAETLRALQQLAPASIVVVGGPGAVSDVVASQLDLLTVGTVTRIAGANRYETAAQLSRFAFPTGVDGVAAVLASGEQFADALGGAALAAALGAPLLLTPRDTVLATTTSELIRVAMNQAVLLLGGPAAVSEAVLEGISDATTIETADDIQYVEIVRVAGADRFETSAIAAAQLVDPFDDAFSVSEVVVATGMNFPDGLVAGALGEPLLLLPSSTIPATTTEVFNLLGPRRVLIMGGTAAVSETQAGILGGLLAGG